jgi:hypothetical protein
MRKVLRLLFITGLALAAFGEGLPVSEFDTLEQLAAWIRTAREE